MTANETKGWPLSGNHREAGQDMTGAAGRAGADGTVIRPTTGAMSPDPGRPSRPAGDTDDGAVTVAEPSAGGARDEREGAGSVDDSADAEGLDAVARLVARAEVPELDVMTLLDELTERAADEGLVDVAWTATDSPIGPLVLAITPAGVVKINFGDDEDALVEELAKRVSPRVLRAPRRLDPVRRELDEYFEGRRQAFDLPLDWRLSRGFRRMALDELAKGVPFGHTVSYKQLAERAGSPKASRAIGSAMATNPIPIIVPCHRVLRTGGDLGGYGGGLDAKRWLLRHEGALLA